MRKTIRTIEKSAGRLGAVTAVFAVRRVARGSSAASGILARASTVTAALLTCLLFFPVAAAAVDGDGGTQSVFSLGAGSRGISLGRAFSTLADDATAIYWNPAALRNVESKQFSLMYMPLYGEFTDATYLSFALVYPTLNAGAFGLGFMRVGSTFDRYDASSIPQGEGEYSESQFMVGYAFERRLGLVSGRLATGASFKIANQKVDPYSSTAPGVDLGFRYLPDFAKPIALAVNFQDLVGAEQKLNTEADRTPRTIMAGIGYTKPTAPRERSWQEWDTRNPSPTVRRSGSCCNSTRPSGRTASSGREPSTRSRSSRRFAWVSTTATSPSDWV